MNALLDTLAYLNWIDRLEGIVSSFLYADWRKAARGGISGIAGELLETASGANRWRIYVPRDCSWSGAEIERFLRHYGVAVWGRGFSGDSIYFSVKDRQANWAEYLLLRRGIPISGKLYNTQNAVYGRQHAPGDRPPAWADQKGPGSIVDRFIDLF